MPKKAKNKWKSINTDAIEDALAEETRQARHGPAVDEVPDADLFFIDTAKDETAVARSLTARRRKREPRLLKCQAIINSGRSAKPVNPGHSRPRVRGPAVKSKPQAGAQQQKRSEAEGDGTALDFWKDGDQEELPAKRAKRARRSAVVQAVEVDAPGCSYNPDYEQHQDAVAEAVAAVVTKRLAEEMVPKSGKVLLHLPPADELDALLEDPVSDEEEAEGQRDPSASEQPPERPPPPAGKAKAPPGKKTRADRNRQKRRKHAETTLKVKQALKKQRRDLQSLNQLQHAITEQEAEKQALAERRAADKAEAARTKPPRLGRHKFEPQPMQVLLSDEIDGSLRRLKGTPVLSMERFKSLQKRGIIEPRGQLQQQRPRKKVTYVDKTSHDERVKENEEVLEIAKANARHEASQKPVKTNKGRKRR